MRKRTLRIGIDAGGTFTDFVVLRPTGSLESFKLRSNPADPAAVILAGIAQAVSGVETAEVIHGSTVATNALLERKGARTAFVTTRGFEHLLAIGRQNRAELYNLTPRPKAPLVPAEWCFGIRERTGPGGEILEPPATAAPLVRELRHRGIESVALCFLHSYANPENERAVAEVLRRSFPVSASHEICPEFREYERSSTTVINAYVAPLMQRYLKRLAAGCPFPLSILQSNGGVLSAAEAQSQAVRTILSGPAGGVVGAWELARRAGFTRVIGFDMGGTSTDVSLSDGGFEETTEAMIDGLPVKVPMLDIVTVGAGGGSLARIDAGGLLRVGPESAGADPGPACYGRGERPTVTDAHVALGRFDSLLGGALPLNATRARRAIESLGLGLRPGAEGVIAVANASMQQAVRAVSVERGHDPRDFTLLAFGGCGGLHACEIAADLGIRTVLFPQLAGVLSALGMLVTDGLRDRSRGVLGRTDHEGVFAELESQAAAGAKLERTADLRYRGQSYEIQVPWSGAARRFEQIHQQRYGYRMDAPIEVVTLRVRERIRRPRVRLPEQPRRSGRGPVILAEYGSTVWIPPGWRYESDRYGTLVATAS